MHRTQRLIAIAAVVAGLAPFSPAHAAAPEPAVVNSDLNAALMYQILLAEISASNGDDANAFSLTLDAARKTNSAKLFERAVELGLRARNADFAIEAARAWQRGFPTSKDANRYVLQILIGTNKLSEIAEPLKRELQGLSGKDRVASINLIPRYFPRVTDKTLAAAMVEQALAADLPTSNYGPAAWTAVGSMRLAANNPSGALDAAQRGSALDGGAEEPAVLALNLMEAKTPSAETIVRKYLSGNALPDIRMAYARTLIGSQRYAEALAQMKTLNQQKPDFPDAWLVRGSLELQDRGNTAAEKSLKKYLSLLPAEQNPDDESETGRGAVQAYLLLAQIAEQDGKPDEANAYLQRIKSPQDALRVTTRRAMLLARQGKLDEARAAIRSAPELQADDARTKLATEIQLLREYKKMDEAYALLGQAVKTYPADTTFAYDQAMVAEKLGRIDEMERLLRQLISKAPDYHHAYNALGYSLADRNVRLPEARQLIQKALEFAPADPFIVDSLAWVEYRSGNLPEAQRLLEQAYASRQDAEIAAHLGEVLWVSGQREAAAKVWRQGLEQQKDNETLLETLKRIQPAL
ncbi:tetratricopeptide repeat protein [Rhodoferax bucti]|uniref:tetratricopeptide repeat protein n=1 Tax=Rhodoferax bucti TaxID=2576305 RepID=UPI001F0EB623|nr:tetratricopeptide repeat protein [Rhodoferax bucti]